MTEPRLPASAAVLGAGTIGVSAAVWFAAHGIPTTIVARRAETVAATPGVAEARLHRLQELGALDETQVEAARSALEVRPGIPEGRSFELIFEAVAEEMGAKRTVLAGAEARLAAGGILVSTTSSLAIDDLSTGLDRSERFAGWHWFHPADLMSLVEIVPGGQTAPDVLESLSVWSRALAKRAIVLRHDTPGFVANRLQYALIREAYALVEAGVCDLADVDTAVTAGLGPRWAAIGPFATMDLAGLAVHEAVAESLFPHLSRRTTSPERLLELRASGAGGARDGRGLLGEYPGGAREALEERRDLTLVALARDPEGE